MVHKQRVKLYQFKSVSKTDIFLYILKNLIPKPENKNKDMLCLFSIKIKPRPTLSVIIMTTGLDWVSLQPPFKESALTNLFTKQHTLQN